MGTDPRTVWALWLPLVVVAVWVGASAPFSVTATAWGLAALSAGSAVGRWTLADRSVFAIRQRAVDVSILAFFALAFAFIALSGRLG
ncbi:MAG: hypothetical protein JW722_04770 [Demequinaceae bacterium]|nr:hypothetical protein [Demequinaceae bacterium]